MTVSDLKRTVDELGKLQAKIADLQAKAEALKVPLLSAGLDAVDGRLFHATVSRFIAKQVDYKSLLTRLKASARLVSSYTQEAERVCVRITARSTRP